LIYPVIIMRPASLYVKLTENIPSMGMLFPVRRQEAVWNNIGEKHS
jgi:hypothetical protein